MQRGIARTCPLTQGLVSAEDWPAGCVPAQRRGLMLATAKKRVFNRAAD